MQANLIGPINNVLIASVNSPGDVEAKQQMFMQHNNRAKSENGFVNKLQFSFPQHVGFVGPSSPCLACQFEKLNARICA